MTDPKTFDVVLFPDPVLRKETEEITAFDDELKGVVEAMFERMFESQGVGLAAPQVGLSMRLFVLNDEGDKDKPERNLALINPTIKSFGGKKTRHEEGCLSLPGVHADITRPEKCVVHHFDVDGNEVEGVRRLRRAHHPARVRPPAGRPARRSDDAQRQAPQPRRGGRAQSRVPSAHREPVLTGRACRTAP